MRAEADSLDDFADGAGLDQLAGFDSSGILEALAVHDRIDALRLPLYAAGFGNLRERGDARLVDHEILVTPHHANAEWRSLIRNRGADDQMNLLFFQNLGLAPRLLCLPGLFALFRGQLRLFGVERDQLCASPKHRARLSRDVPVVQADGRKANAPAFRPRPLGQ